MKTAAKSAKMTAAMMVTIDNISDAFAYWRAEAAELEARLRPITATTKHSQWQIQKFRLGARSTDQSYPLLSHPLTSLLLSPLKSRESEERCKVPLRMVPPIGSHAFQTI